LGAVGVEFRKSPFDRELAEFCLSLPAEAKLRAWLDQFWAQALDAYAAEVDRQWEEDETE